MSLTFTPHRRATPAPAPPFASNSANNGLSVDAVSGAIVLGNDVGDNGAILSNDREICGNGSSIVMPDVPGGIRRIVFNENGYFVEDPLAQKAGFYTGGLTEITDLTGGPQLRFIGLADGAGIQFIESLFQLQFQGTVASPLCTIDTNSGDFISGGNIGSSGKLIAGSTVETTDPGGGAGEWQLGVKTAGAVVLDPNNHVKIRIGGAIVKLLIST